MNPRFGEAYGDMGRGFYEIDDIPDSAIYFYRKAIDVTPNAAVDYRNLGLVYLTLQKYRLASFYFNMAYAINPATMQDAQHDAAELRKNGIDVVDYPGGENPALDNLQLPVLSVPGSHPE